MERLWKAGSWILLGVSFCTFLIVFIFGKEEVDARVKWDSLLTLWALFSWATAIGIVGSLQDQDTSRNLRQILILVTGIAKIFTAAVMIGGQQLHRVSVVAITLDIYVLLYACVLMTFGYYTIFCAPQAAPPPAVAYVNL